jgi:hypothetical protein
MPPKLFKKKVGTIKKSSYEFRRSFKLGVGDITKTRESAALTFNTRADLCAKFPAILQHGDAKKTSKKC